MNIQYCDDVWHGIAIDIKKEVLDKTAPGIVTKVADNVKYNVWVNVSVNACRYVRVAHKNMTKCDE